MEPQGRADLWTMRVFFQEEQIKTLYTCDILYIYILEYFYMLSDLCVMYTYLFIDMKYILNINDVLAAYNWVFFSELSIH